MSIELKGHKQESYDGIKEKLKNGNRTIDTIGEKIERLKAYCKKYPYAFSNFAGLKRKFELEGKEEDIEYLEQIYYSYQYINGRKSQGKLSKDLVQDLKEAKIGGIYGIAKEDEELARKYKISNEIMTQLIMDFGSADNFKKSYIQYKIDISKAKTKEEIQRVNDENSDMLLYMDRLPLVKDFDFSGKKYCKVLANKILRRTFGF